MTAVSNGVLVYASDPEPSAAEIVFDFIQGTLLLAVALQADLITGTLAETLADATSDAAGTFTDATAPEAPPVRAVDPVPMPRPTGMGRIVYLTLTADLGGVIAQTSPRIEFADEELIEIV